MPSGAMFESLVLGAASSVPVGVAAPVLVGATACSLAASAVLVRRVERLGERLSLADAAVGLLAALCADSPEITAAVTAIAGHQRNLGAGVVLGSNVFNLAALLGLAALVSGRVALRRRAVVLEGIVGTAIACVALVTVLRLIGTPVGLALGAALFATYAGTVSVPAGFLERAGVPRRLAVVLEGAVRDEASQLTPALDPPSKSAAGDTAVAGVCLAVVIAASIVMETSALWLGRRLALPGIVTGGVLLAALTSLPNAVSAVYLASRNRGAAVMSEAMNSNNLNVLLGLLVPGAILGLGGLSRFTAVSAGWYLGLTLGSLLLLYMGRGLRRVGGAFIVLAYAAFVVVLITG